MTARAALLTPLGRLVVGEADGVITELRWSDEAATADSPLLRRALAQLAGYFDGQLQLFDLPLDWGRG